jgi:hypothetical protein
MSAFLFMREAQQISDAGLFPKYEAPVRGWFRESLTVVEFSGKRRRVKGVVYIFCSIFIFSG